MSKFVDLAEEALAFLRNKLEGLESLFAPLAKSALKAGESDLAADARAAVAEVIADPSLLRDAQRRDAAVAQLAAQVAKQGAAIGENELHAFVAAALVERDAKS